MRKKKVWVMIIMLLLVCCFIEGKVVIAQDLNLGGMSVREGEVYTFKNVSSGWYMNIGDAEKSNGTEIDLCSRDNGRITGFVFHIMDATLNMVKISPELAPEKYLDVRRKGKPFKVGQNICIWEEDNDPLKHLIFDVCADGSFYLSFAEHPEYCIAAQSEIEAETEKTLLVVCQKTGEAEQRWYLCDANGKNIMIRKQYEAVNDEVHKVIEYYDNWISGICFNENIYTEQHQFINGKCENCGYQEVPRTTGIYFSDTEVRVKKNMFNWTKTIKRITQGTEIMIVKVELDSFGNYWGRLEDESGYVRMKDLKKDGAALIVDAMDVLWDKLGEKYFTTTGEACAIPGVSNHGCKKCSVPNVVTTSWFKDMFGTINTDYFPSHNVNATNRSFIGRSCFGFACFAQYYVYSCVYGEQNMIGKEVAQGEFTPDFAKKNIVVGDVLRLEKYRNSPTRHSVLVYSINENDITVIDCNWGIGSSGNCKITKHNLSSENYKYVYVNRPTISTITPEASQ